MDSIKQINKLEAALQQAQAAKDIPQTISLLARLGREKFESDAIRPALQDFEAALALATQSGDPAAQAHLNGLKAMALRKLRDLPGAIQAYEQAVAIAAANNQPALESDANLQLGLVLLETGDELHGIRAVERAFNLAITHNDLTRQMYIAGLLGNFHANKQAFRKAHDQFTIAAGIADKLRNPQAACTYQISLGSIYLAQNRHTRAIEHYQKALQFALYGKDKAAELRSLMQLMIAYIEAEAVEPAEEYGRRAIDLAHALRQTDSEINYIAALSQFLSEQGQIEKALPFIQRGVELASGQQDGEWELSMRSKLAEACYHLEDYPAALEQYTQALGIAEQAQNKAMAAQLQGRIGSVLADQALYDQALPAIQAAVELSRALDKPALLGEQLILLGLTYRDAQQSAEARQVSLEALECFQRAGNQEMIEKVQAFLDELGA